AAVISMRRLKKILYMVYAVHYNLIRTRDMVFVLKQFTAGQFILLEFFKNQSSYRMANTCQITGEDLVSTVACLDDIAYISVRIGCGDNWQLHFEIRKQA